MTTSQRPSRDAFEVAAHWHGVFDDGDPDPAQRAQFETWLAADPAHRAAYQSVARAWAGMANAAVDERILRMRRAALAVPRERRWSWIRSTGIAASAVMAVALVGAVAVRYDLLRVFAPAKEFATQLGQRSSITLDDGSTVMLNTDSRLRVEFDAQVRRVRLLAGQAWFEVAKNQPRPFVVEAGDRQVTAHGTAFDIRLEGHDQVQVTLIEGRVSVDAVPNTASSPLAADHVDLLPGDQVIASAARPATKRRTDVGKTTSWRDGQIIFDDDTLAAAIAEVNRYSAKKIVLVDSRLANLRMSGVFTAGHNDSFLETVTSHFSIEVTQASDGRLLLAEKN